MLASVGDVGVSAVLREVSPSRGEMTGRLSELEGGTVQDYEGADAVTLYEVRTGFAHDIRWIPNRHRIVLTPDYFEGSSTSFTFETDSVSVVLSVITTAIAVSCFAPLSSVNRWRCWAPGWRRVRLPTALRAPSPCPRWLSAFSSRGSGLPVAHRDSDSTGP